MELTILNPFYPPMDKIDLKKMLPQKADPRLLDPILLLGTRE